MLTKRQVEALQLAANGERVEDIATKLGVSVRTAQEHLKQAREALEAKNTTEAVAKGIRGKIILSLAFVLSVNAYDSSMMRPNRINTRPNTHRSSSTLRARRET